jgi:spore coat protein U-like protein
MSLTYTSFQAGDATRTTSFELKCTNTTSYTVGFDVASGNVLGLNYNLAVSPPSGLGTGTAQTAPGHTVTATVPGGQAGTCAAGTCSSSVTRNVTVTY